MIGRYELIDRLAVGGMAELFLARSTSAHGSDRPVVIKRMLPHMATDPHFSAMFVDEAKLTNRLSHPNIAGTYELGRQGDQLYMVMEYVDGIDCLAVLRECARESKRLPEETAVHIAYQVLEALDFAHNEVDDEGRPLGVVHRDISPSNVILSRRGEVKLVDFGIARATMQEHQTKDGTLKGKYGYMSPEQVLEEGIDARSDLFSAGILLAELLMGRRLFAARNDLDVLLMVRDVRLSRLERYGDHIDADLGRILRKALQKKREERYANAAAFRSALGAWLAHHAKHTSEAAIVAIVDIFYDCVHGQRDGASAERTATADEPSAPQSGSVLAHIARPSDGSAEGPYVEVISGIPSGRIDIGDSLPVISISEGIPEPIGATGASSGVVHIGSTSDESHRIELDDLISGPLPAAQLAEFLNSKVGADAHDFDDRLVSGAAIQPPPPSALERAAPLPTGDIDAPDDTGDFQSSPPIGVFYRLATTRATGLLRARVGGIRKDVYFHAGIPEYVSSNLNSERFGEYLVKHGIITPGQLTHAVSLLPHYHGKLGDTLVALNLLAPLEVFRLLTRQVRDKLVDLCTWGRGTFAWYGGRKNPTEAFPLDLNAFEIMGAGAMQLPDVVVQAWLERLPRACRPRVNRDARVGIEVFQCGAFLDQVYGDMHSDVSLTALLDFYNQEREQFVRALYLLAHTEFIDFKVVDGAPD